jgi:hypothetical protein
MNNLDHFGTWHYQNQIFYDRISAIRAASKDNNTYESISFKYYDEEFDKINWTVEPDISLQEYYDKRAWELRNQYDYIVLFYSGGHDSHNILDTFARNKLPIDEIIIRATNLENLDENNINIYSYDIETKLVAYPIAKYYKETYFPHVKITFQDNTKLVVDFWKNNSKLHEKNQFVPDPVHSIRLDYNRNFNIINENKKIAYILGADKPFINHDDIGYYTFINDDNSFRQAKRKHDQNYNIEFFYWHKNAAPMIAKQCHMILKDIQNKNLLEYASHKTDPYWIRAKEDYYATVLYNRTVSIPVEIPKSAQKLWDSASDWFFHDRNSDHFKIFHKHLWEWKKEFGSFLPDTKTFLEIGLPKFSTKRRYFKYHIT